MQTASRGYIWSLPKDILFVFIPFILGSVVFIGSLSFFKIEAVNEPLRMLYYFFAVLLIDKGHVYSTFLRIWVDPHFYSRRKFISFGIPLCVFAFIALFSYFLGWSNYFIIHTYVGFFHFVRQQAGFINISNRKFEGVTKFTENFDSFAAMAVGFLPYVYWSSVREKADNPPFVLGEIFTLPKYLGRPSLALYLLVIASYLAVQIYNIHKMRSGYNWAKFFYWLMTLVMFSPLIFLKNAIIVITMIIFGHGIPYMFLIAEEGRLRWKNDLGWRKVVFNRSVLISIFITFGLVAWIQHGLILELLNPGNKLQTFHLQILTHEPSKILLHLMGATLFTFPLSHFIIDAFIWKSKDIESIKFKL